MKPMLAKKYTGTNIKFPCYLQPKLNGVRAVWLPGQGLLSRGRPNEEGKLWLPSVLPVLHEQLAQIDYPLDGELYVHGRSLQQINSIVAVNRVTPHTDHHHIIYNVFDTPMAQPFRSRLNYINELGLIDLPNIQPVPTYFVTSAKQSDLLHLDFISSGYEGSIYRDASAHYGFEHACSNKENRWSCLLKRKDWNELDATIVGFEQEVSVSGQPKPSLGSLILRANNREFKAGSGLTQFQREFYWREESRPRLIGSTVKIRYEVLSDGGIPLKPTVLFVEDGHLFT